MAVVSHQNGDTRLGGIHYEKIAEAKLNRLSEDVLRKVRASFDADNAQMSCLLQRAPSTSAVLCATILLRPCSSNGDPHTLCSNSRSKLVQHKWTRHHQSSHKSKYTDSPSNSSCTQHLRCEQRKCNSEGASPEDIRCESRSSNLLEGVHDVAIG